MLFLKANTAVDVLIGPFVDDTDGKTAETGLTISQADIRLSKNGQNMAQKNDATAAVHDELGYYNCELDATDTNTEGNLTLLVHESGALPVRHEYQVLSEAAWDSMFAAKDTGYMNINVNTVNETAQTANDNGADINAILLDTAEIANLNDVSTSDLNTACDTVTVTSMAANVMNASALATDAVTEIQSGLATPTNITAGTIATVTNAVTTDSASRTASQADVSSLATSTELSTHDGKLDTVDGIVDTILVDTADMQPRVAAIEVDTGTTLDGKIDTIDGIVDSILTDTAAILVDTNELQTDGIAALITELNNLSAANVNAEIVDALATDTYAEPGDEAPGATISLSDKINYIYKFLRNKIETTQTRIHVYNDAGDNKDHSSIIADNGTTTFTRGEFGAGDA